MREPGAWGRWSGVTHPWAISRVQRNKQHRTSNIEHPTSNIQHRTSNIEHPTSNIQRRTSNIEHPTSNIQRRTSNVEHPTSNIQRPTHGSVWMSSGNGLSFVSGANGSTTKPSRKIPHIVTPA